MKNKVVYLYERSWCWREKSLKCDIEDDENCLNESEIENDMNVLKVYNYDVDEMKK